MRIKRLLKNKVVLIALSSTIVLLAAGVTYAATQTKKIEQKAVNVVTSTPVKEEPVEQTPPTVESPAESAPQSTPVQASPEPTPAPTRPDYLYSSLKASISAADEEKTWQCFTLAEEQLLQRDNFSNETLTAQVSRNLQYPCGNAQHSPDGRFITSYVEWCLRKAAGEQVPAIVSENVAVQMCAGF